MSPCMADYSLLPAFIINKLYCISLLSPFGGFDGLYIVTQMESLEAKQKYLRQNIPAKLYEEFSAYLEEHIGNEDIERWSKEFVVEVVDDFLKSREQQPSELQTSFYNYQHAKDQPHQTSKDMRNSPKIKQQANRPKQQQAKPKQQQVKMKQQLKVSKAETSSIDVKPKSALNLFDSVFQSSSKSSKNQPAKIEVPKSAQSKPADTSKLNAFDSNQFWSSTIINKPNNDNKNNNNKLSKSNVDFTSFDFWSQPKTKSVQELKPINIQAPLSARVQPLSTERPSTIPSFDELLSKMKEQIKEGSKDAKNVRKEEKQVQNKNEKVGKAPSPYQKKNYPQERIASPATNVKKVPYEGQIVFKTDFKDLVKCFPSAQRQQFKGKDLSVIIQHHEIVSRTFLMPDYVMYSIRVQPSNVLIQRNYEDFTRLRAVLSAFYPGTKLAYLEGIGWFGATGAQHIKRQKIMLQFFLNDLLRNKEIRNSRFLEDFLTLQEHKKIKRKFQQFQRLERPKGIEELCLLQGKVNVNISEQQRQYQQHLKKYQERVGDYLDRQEKLSITLAEQYKAVAGTLQELIDLTTAIIDETKRFNERVFGLQVQGVEQVFKLIRGCYAEEKKLAGFNLQLISTAHLPFLSYQRANTKQLQELIATQQSFLRSYLKRTQSEKIDPSIPYTSDKLSYSKVSVGTQSKSLTVLKYQAGFFGNQLCHQSKRTYETLSSKFRQLWSRTALRKQQQCLRSLDFWRALGNPMPS